MNSPAWKLFVLTVGALLLGASFASARPNTTRMSCPDVRALVARSGAVLLGTGGHTYDRYVHHRGYCSPHERLEDAYVPTRNGVCHIGYTCEPIMDPDDRDPN